MKRIFLLITLLSAGVITKAQESFPINGVRDIRSGLYAFTNATIVQNEKSKLENATLIIKQGKIIAVGVGLAIPNDAVVIDCSKKFIYPSFVMHLRIMVLHQTTVQPVDLIMELLHNLLQIKQAHITGTRLLGQN